MTNSYNMQGNKRVLIILNWLGSKGLQFVQTLNNIVQENCRTSVGLFEVLSAKFKPQHNETNLC